MKVSTVPRLRRRQPTELPCRELLPASGGPEVGAWSVAQPGNARNTAQHGTFFASPAVANVNRRGGGLPGRTRDFLEVFASRFYGGFVVSTMRGPRE